MKILLYKTMKFENHHFPKKERLQLVRDTTSTCRNISLEVGEYDKPEKLGEPANRIKPNQHVLAKFVAVVLRTKKPSKFGRHSVYHKQLSYLIKTDLID